MECFWPEIDKRGIKTIFHLGDCFDRRKFINFNSLNNCRRYFFDQAKQRSIQLVMIVGNHDTFYKNTNHVNSPGLLLREYDNIVAYSGPVEYSLDGLSILLMPWICTENYEESMAALKISTSPVCFGHFEIEGFTMYKGHESHEGFSPKLFSHFDLVCSGHYHHRSSHGNISYLGNPYELTWSDYDDPRGFHIFDTHTKDLEFIENPFKMFHKVYYDDVKKEPLSYDHLKDSHVKVIVVNKNDFYLFDQFIEKLYQINPLELKIIEDMSEFEADAVQDEKLDVEDTLTLLTQYVDNIETDADKERIKTLMKTLYVEAQHFEET